MLAESLIRAVILIRITRNGDPLQFHIHAVAGLEFRDVLRRDEKAIDIHLAGALNRVHGEAERRVGDYLSTKFRFIGADDQGATCFTEVLTSRWELDIGIRIGDPPWAFALEFEVIHNKVTGFGLSGSWDLGDQAIPVAVGDTWRGESMTAPHIEKPASLRRDCGFERVGLVEQRPHIVVAARNSHGALQIHFAGFSVIAVVAHFAQARAL